VLIVGGGIAGLSLAIALRQRGIEPALIERARDWTADGAGLYLVGNATRALRALGLDESVLGAGRQIRTQTVFNQRGKPLAVSDVDTFWKSCGPCLGVRRSRLYSALVDRIADVNIRFGVTVESLQQRATDVVVQSSDGSEELYDLVVGADGIRSSVRRLEFGGTAPTFREQVGWRFIAPLPTGIEGWSAFLGAGRTFLFVPLGNDEAYCYADTNVPQPIDDPEAGRLERLRSLFADFAPPVREALARMRESDPIHFAPIEQVIQPLTGYGRLVLIGDAAHAMSPSMASGAALAFEDALVLAELLAGTNDVNAAVSEFVRRRTARVEWIRSQTERRDRIRKWPPAVRNVALRLFWPKIYAANYQPLVAPP
jgi:2-polyprenyl-6-methoxyphenol hydroxylase-like FAD-dependent oxidoreductase